jgi:hypothetical protein
MLRKTKIVENSLKRADCFVIKRVISIAAKTDSTIVTNEKRSKTFKMETKTVRPNVEIVSRMNLLQPVYLLSAISVTVDRIIQTSMAVAVVSTPNCIQFIINFPTVVRVQP